MGQGIALVGFMGSGKSTVGRALADRLGWPFVDLDDVLAARHGPIADQIARDGLAAFRRRERDAALALCDGEVRVLATGGGTLEDPELERAIGAAYRTVFLDVPLETIAGRIGHLPGRPLWDADVARRFADRRPVYLRSDVVLAADGDPDQWAAAIVGLLPSPLPRGRGEGAMRIASAAEYPVVVAPSFDGLDEVLPDGDAVLVTESTVGPLWAEAVERALGSRVRARVVVPAGEVHKDRAAWSAVCDALLDAGVDRGTPVLALGGGVLGDLAGFAAATTLRGLPVVQLPTTLLAMVDSSVGGKVAVNHPRGKNLIGAFHPPIAVWMALRTLSTLPPAEHACGWGEILKTALAVDGALFDALEGGLLERALAGPGLSEVIERCVRAKAAVVAVDERETGPRMALNAGHTVGHALEAALGPGTVPHGVAVAIGLRIELALSVELGFCEDDALPARLDALIDRVDLPGAPRRGRAPWADDLEPERFVAGIGVDKKAVGDKIRVPLPVRAGEVRLVDLSRTELASRLTRLTCPSESPLGE